MSDTASGARLASSRVDRDRPDIASARSFWRASVYLAAAQLHLRANCLLDEPLTVEQIKRPVLGHWGTSPGICFAYAHLSDLVRRTGRRVALVLGAGHAAPAMLACTYLDGTLSAVYPELRHGRAGLELFVSRFARPGGFETEISAAMPGTVYVGGELGPALSVAQGLALDAPELTVACVIGDGEFETGPTACAWQGMRLIDPAESGAVLPIVHLNGFRMGARSLLSHWTERELRQFFDGSGYEPLLVGPSHEQMACALTTAHERLLAISMGARTRPRWPVIVMRTPKGWSGPDEWQGRRVEGGAGSHKSPFRAPAENARERIAIERWLASYRPAELFDADGHPRPEVSRCLPVPRSRLGAAAVASDLTRCLTLPLAEEPPAEEWEAGGERRISSAEAIADYLARVVRANRASRVFRVFSPDELSSNRLTGILGETDLAAPQPHAAGELPASPRGRVMEVLSEHLCVGWLEGYLQGGRHGIFASYEGFAPIVSSMVAQYLKFLAVSRELPWRPPRASLTFLLTSLCWNNCYTHQNPAFIDSLLCGEWPFVRVYTPNDSNAALDALRASLGSRDRVNVIVASKLPPPAGPGSRAADQASARGGSERGDLAWSVADARAERAIDVVLAAAGDRMYVEALRALGILGVRAPELNVRLIGVQEATALGAPERFEAALSDERFVRDFTADGPVHVAFTGHPGALKQLFFDRPAPGRFSVSGFSVSSGQTTPFGLMLRNGVDRFTLAGRVAELALARRPELEAEVGRLRCWIERRQAAVLDHIAHRGVDPDWLGAHSDVEDLTAVA